MPEPIMKPKTPPKIQASIDSYIRSTKPAINHFPMDEKNDFLAPMPMWAPIDTKSIPSFPEPIVKP